MSRLFISGITALFSGEEKLIEKENALSSNRLFVFIQRINLVNKSGSDEGDEKNIRFIEHYIYTITFFCVAI